MTHDIYVKQLINQAIQLDQQEKKIEAFNEISKLIDLDISSLDDLLQCARIAEKAKKYDEAAAWYNQAWQVQPSNVLRESYLINLMESGKLDEAEQEARLAVRKSSKNVNFWNTLGLILKRKNQLKEAIDIFKQASKIDSRKVSLRVNTGNCYLALYEPHKAIESFKKALKIQPSHAEVMLSLAKAYKDSRQYQKAIDTLNTAIKIAPNNVQLKNEQVSVFFQSGQFDLALQINKELIALEPNQTSHLRHRGMLLRRMGKLQDAIVLYQQILVKYPDDLETILALGKLLHYSLNDLKATNELYERACLLFPGDIALNSDYCRSLSNSRYGDESEHFAKAYQIAVRLLNNDPALLLSASYNLQSVLLRTADYEKLKKLGERGKLLQYWLNCMEIGALQNQLGRVETLQDRIELVTIHQQWGKKIQDVADKHPIKISHLSSKREKIRIGFMSSDLRHHPVTYFAQPLLEQYDKTRFELYCYSFYPGNPDRVQKRISETVDRFAVYPELNHQQIAQEIANDQLDILFELGGTTLLNKVEVCAYRPAPIQVSWLGYPHSAGIPTIDYILVDPYTKPTIDGLIIEKPFEMPETWVSLGSLGFYDAAIENTLPEQRHGYITFGTANNPYKYTPASFAAWASVMQQVEHSHFLFLRPEAGVQIFRENVYKHFNEFGISSDRILFMPVRRAHLQHYNLIDIALDPFPHVGGTTTCESIWMGVPVITLIGAGIFERLSYSNLTNAGLADLCATSVEDYIKIAVNLAHDKDRRETLRFDLRRQIRANPLGQTERFVRNFEAQIIKIVEHTTELFP